MAPISLFSPAQMILPSSLLSAPFPSVPVSSPFSPPFLFVLLLKLKFVIFFSVGMRNRGKLSVGINERAIRETPKIGGARFDNATNRNT